MRRLILVGALAVASCEAEVFTVGSPPLADGSALLAVEAAGELRSYFGPAGAPLLDELPGPPGRAELGLFARPASELLLAPEPDDRRRLALVPADRGLAPDRTFAWDGVAWVEAAPELLLGRGLPVLSGRACLERGGCWADRPTVGWGACTLGCTVGAEPAPPAPPNLGPPRTTLTAPEAEARVAACLANLGRMAPSGACVRIGRATCEPPPADPGRVSFVSPVGGGDGSAPDRPTSLTAARAGEVSEWVLLPGEYEFGELPVTRPLLIRGVCAAAVVARGDLVVSADLTLADLQWEGDLRRGDGAPVVHLADVVLRRGAVGDGPGFDLYGFLGSRVVIERSYVGPLEPALDPTERRRTFGVWPSGDAASLLTVEASTLVGGVGAEVVAGTGLLRVEVVDSAIVGGWCHAGLTLRRGVRAEVRGSLVVGGAPGGPELGHECPARGGGTERRPLDEAIYLDGQAQLRLRDVEVLGSGTGVGVGARGQLVAERLRVRGARWGLVGGSRASITAEDVELAVGPPREARRGPGYAAVSIASATVSLARVAISGSVGRFFDLFLDVHAGDRTRVSRVVAQDLSIVADVAPPYGAGSAREVFRVVEGSQLELDRVEVEGLGGAGLGGIALRLDASAAVVRDLVVQGGGACSASSSLCLAAGGWLAVRADLSLERARFERIDRGLELVGPGLTIALTDVETRAVACPINDARSRAGDPDPLTELATLRADRAVICEEAKLEPRP